MYSKPVDMRVRPHVRIENASLDESETSYSGLVMCGRIAPSTLRFLKVDQVCQRGLENRLDIDKVLPDNDVRVRGQNFETAGDDFSITSPAYIVDNEQGAGISIRLLTDLNNNIKKVSAVCTFRNLRNDHTSVLTLFSITRNELYITLYERAMQWFSDRWPEKAEWPEGITRQDNMSTRTEAELSHQLWGSGMKSPIVVSVLRCVWRQCQEKAA